MTMKYRGLNLSLGLSSLVLIKLTASFSSSDCSSGNVSSISRSNNNNDIISSCYTNSSTLPLTQSHLSRQELPNDFKIMTFKNEYDNSNQKQNPMPTYVPTQTPDDNDITSSSSQCQCHYNLLQPFQDIASLASNVVGVLYLISDVAEVAGRFVYLSILFIPAVVSYPLGKTK